MVDRTPIGGCHGGRNKTEGRAAPQRTGSRASQVPLNAQPLAGGRTRAGGREKNLVESLGR